MIKILLVDDDFLVRTFLSRLTDWESHGYTLVGAAQDGEEALRMVEEYHPDIIITDVSMPVMDGIELIRRLRKGGNTARIVALSCHDDFDYVKEAMKLGADEYVLKNLLTEERLLALLRELKPSAGAQSGAMQFEGPEQERDYYLRLLRGDSDAKNGSDSFHISAAMAIVIVHYDGYVGSMTLEQQKKFHSSFAQICREAGQNQPNIRCIHVRQEQYAVLMDLSGVSSVYERRQMIQRYAAAAVGYAERYLAVAIRLGTSSAESFQISPKECWQEARDALNERFYAGQAIFYGWQTPACGREIPPRAQEFCRILTASIERRDGGTIRRMWEESLEEFRAEHTEARLVQEWLRQADRSAGVAARTAPESIEDFEGLEQVYLTFREEILPMPEQYSSAVSQTIRFLQENHEKNISLNDAAEAVHLNAAYLSHLFRKETGITFSEYLLSCRINRAKELLMHTNDKIREIGFRSGFHDYRNFCKMFKKTVGMTPQCYRRQCAGE